MFRRRGRAVLHRPKWFQAEDGTYYRNCPLIMAERKAALAMGRYLLFERLGDEWHECFREGVFRKATLDKNDRLATPVPFRVAYPDKPGLWVLDEMEF